MEYYTNYTLDVYAETVEKAFIIMNTLRDENKNVLYAIEESGETYKGSKWHEHETDLISFSKKHPSVKFILSGEGEQQGDVWKKTFINGEVQTQRTKLIFEEKSCEKEKRSFQG